MRAPPMRSMMRRGTSLPRSPGVRPVAGGGATTSRLPVTRPRHESSRGAVCAGEAGAAGVVGRSTRSRQFRAPEDGVAEAGGGLFSRNRSRFTAPRPESGESPCGGTRPSMVPGVPGDGTPDPAGMLRGAPEPAGAPPTITALRTIRSRTVLESSGSRRKNGVISVADPEPSLPVPLPIPRRATLPIAAAGSLISDRVKRAGVPETVANPPAGSRRRR